MNGGSKVRIGTWVESRVPRFGNMGGDRCQLNYKTLDSTTHFEILNLMSALIW